MDWLLGVDDTDVLGHRPGTGRLAREMGTYLGAATGVAIVGVVRQQLLVDPRIPYTSHNSPACVILGFAEEVEVPNRVFHAAATYVAAHSAPGSDPGLCLAPLLGVPEAVRAFGTRAAHAVVAMTDAERLAAEHQIRLVPLGGTGGGVIGALAAVGLTAGGNAGRFLEYGGALRELGDTVSAADLARRGIVCLSVSPQGEAVPPDALVETAGWLRPRLIGGQPVVFLEPLGARWRCFDRKGGRVPDEAGQ